MGIIRAIGAAIGGGLADQWLEVIEADNMDDNTVFTEGVPVRSDDRRRGNQKGTPGLVSDGSIVHVYPNQFMLLVSGGKVVDYTAEEGFFQVKNGAAPSLFNGQFGEALKETFSRIKYDGVPSAAQKVYFVNMQEIKGIKFGTRNPVNYFDNFYNAELFLRANGTYSIKITDPLLFYREAVSKNATHVNINEMNAQYLDEFLEALQSAINQMSADGERISFVTSKSSKLGKYMANVLDEDWKRMRGIEVQSVGIGSLSYSEDSQKLINMRNQGAMLSDPTVREGYVQGSVARGMEAAGSNSAGAGMAFMGMGMGMNAAGNFMGSSSQANMQQMQMQQQAAAQQAAAQQQAAAVAAPVAAAPAAGGGWTCKCGQTGNSGKFCSECGSQKPEEPAGWTCSCGQYNTGKFCPECGGRKPEKPSACPSCGFKLEGGAKFCPECGTKIG